MVRHSPTEPTTTTTTNSASDAGVNAKTFNKGDVLVDDDGTSSFLLTNGDATSAAAAAMAEAEADRSACRPEHGFHAFDALYCALTRATPIKPLFTDDKYPLFVTWNTRVARRSSVGNNNNHSNNSNTGGNRGWGTRLRGCIGTFDAQPLRAGLEEYALLSAFRDHRFRRVELRELTSLECGISLLTDFENATSYRDWIIGTHGIQITFSPPQTSPSASDAPSPLSSAVSLLSRPFLSSLSHTTTTTTTTSSSSQTSHHHHHRRTMSATYLPEVAPDQGWGHIDAIDSAIRKAGWNGRISEDLRRSVRVRRYRSRKCVVGWDEFVAWRAERGSPVVAFDHLLDDHQFVVHDGYDRHHGHHGEEEEEEDDEEDEGGF